MTTIQEDTMTERLKIVDVNLSMGDNGLIRVYAETEYGHLYMHNGVWMDTTKAFRALARIYAHRSINPKYWTYVRTVYGTNACVDEQFAEAEREWEDDMSNQSGRWW